MHAVVPPQLPAREQSPPISIVLPASVTSSTVPSQPRGSLPYKATLPANAACTSGSAIAALTSPPPIADEPQPASERVHDVVPSLRSRTWVYVAHGASVLEGVAFVSPPLGPQLIAEPTQLSHGGELGVVVGALAGAGVDVVDAVAVGAGDVPGVPEPGAPCGSDGAT